MKTKIEKALKESAIKTFEDICFMYLEPELEDEQKNLALEAAAQVKFKGDYNGRLVVETRGGLFAAIAANMLGNDLPSFQQKNDALGEVANIICGNVVPSLGRKSGQEYKIESPAILSVDEIPAETEKPLAQVTLNLSEGRADIKFFLDDKNSFKEKKD